MGISLAHLIQPPPIRPGNDNVANSRMHLSDGCTQTEQTELLLADLLSPGFAQVKNCDEVAVSTPSTPTGLSNVARILSSGGSGSLLHNECEDASFHDFPHLPPFPFTAGGLHPLRGGIDVSAHSSGPL